MSGLKRHPRNGYSIIELLTVIGLCSGVFVLAVFALNRLHEVHNASQRSHDLTQTLFRLERQFRNDCRRSKSIQLPNKKQVCVFTSEQQIEYRRLPERLIRTVKSARGTSTVSFLLPMELALTWSQQDQRVVLRIHHDPSADGLTPSFQDQRFVAILGSERNVSGLAVQQEGP